MLVVDRPAAAAVAEAAEFLEGRGLRVTQRSDYSVSVAAPVPDGHPGDEQLPPAALDRESAALGALRSGSAQVAAVPLQLRPEWCRVWVTVNDAGAVAAAAEALVAVHRQRSLELAPAVEALERDVYGESRWPEYAARLRAGLRGQGMSEAELEQRLASFKRRWESLGKKTQRPQP